MNFLSPHRFSNGGAKRRAVHGLTAGATAALGALAGCGGGGTTTASGNDGGSGNTTPVSLSAEPGSPIIPINLAAGYFSGGGDSPLAFEVMGLDGSGLMFDEANGRIFGTVAAEGEVRATVTATGGDADPVSRIFIITATAPAAGTAPRPMAIEDLEFLRNVVAGRPIESIDLRDGFADPDGGDDLTFAVEFSPNDSGLSFDGNGVISGTISGEGDVVAIVTVANGGESDAPSIEYRIVISPTSGGDPVLSGTRLADVRGTTGDALVSPIDLRAGFDDPDGDDGDLTIAAHVVGMDGGLEDLSSVGLALTGGSMLSGTPNRAGIITIRVTATDGSGGVATDDFTINVRENRPPTVTETPPAGVELTMGTSENLPIDAAGWFTDPDGNETLTFSLVDADGTGLSIDAGTGMITGPFSGTEDTTIRVRAGDGRLFVDHPLNITANTAPVTTDSAPMDSVALTTGSDLGLPIDAGPWFSDADDGQTLTYSLMNAENTGLSIDAQSGLITGPFTGNADTSVEVRAGDGRVIIGHTLNIAANAAPTTTATARTDAVILTTGGDLNLPIPVGGWFSDADAGATLTYSLVDADNTGLSIDSSDMIIGPFTGSADATIRVRATDQHGATADHALTIEANAAPTTTQGASTDTVRLTTGRELNLPIPVSGWFRDSDAGATLTFSLVGAENTGLSIDSAGMITGPFTGNADSTIRVRATDQHGATADHALSIEANAAPTTSRSAPDADQVIFLAPGTDLNLPIDASAWFADTDGDDTLRFSLVDSNDLDGTGLTFDTKSGEIRGVFSGAGAATIRVRASDGQVPVEHAVNIRAAKPVTLTNLPESLIVPTGTPIPAMDLSGVFAAPAEGVTRTYGAMVGTDSLMAANIGLSISSDGILSGTFTGTDDTEVTLTASDGQTSLPEQSITIRTSSANGGRPFESGNDDDEFLIGAAAIPVIVGGDGEDIILAGPGQQKIYGDVQTNPFAADTDVVVYLGERDQYNFIQPLSVTILGNTRLTIQVKPIGANNTQGDELLGIDEIRFEDQTFVVSFSGTTAHDIVFGSNASDRISGGAGDDILYSGFGGDEDTAVYTGEIRDFRIEMSELLSITDADSLDGTDEGSDRLHGYEKVRFADNVGVDRDSFGVINEVNTDNIIFGSGNSGSVSGHASERNIFYGEDGGYVFTGGTGADIFQFLKPADSTSTSTTTIQGYDRSDGDRIALGKEIGTVTVTEDGTNTYMSNSSGFSLTIEGTGHDFAVGSHYYHIGAEAEIILTRGTELNPPIDLNNWFPDPGDAGDWEISLVNPMDLDGTGLTFHEAGGEIRGNFTGTRDATIRFQAGNGQDSIDHEIHIKAINPIALTSLPDVMVMMVGESIPAIDMSGVFPAPSMGASWVFSAAVGSESLADADIGLSISPAGIMTGAYNGSGDMTVTLTATDGQSAPQSDSFIVRTNDGGGGGRNFRAGDNRDELLIGTGSNDDLFGGEGSDLFYGGDGTDTFYGGDNTNPVDDTGTDVVLFELSRSDYTFDFVDFHGVAFTILSNEDLDNNILAANFLYGIDEVRFADQTFVDSANGTADNDIVMGTAGNDTITGRAGDDALGAGSGGDDDTAVYTGEINDFRFEFFRLLSITDADTADGTDGTDEGSDRLSGFEVVEFANGVEVNTANIEFGSDNSGVVDAHDTEASILYGEGGGYTFNGGAGRDIFQFLTSADSTAASASTVRGFDQSQGDRIALGQEIGAVTVTASGGNTVMTNASGFSLTIEGVVGFAADTHYYHIGGAPASNSAVRAPVKEGIPASVIGEGRASPDHDASRGAVPTIADFAVDGDDAGSAFGIPTDSGVRAAVEDVLPAGPDVPGDAVIPPAGCDDYACSLGLI